MELVDAVDHIRPCIVQISLLPTRQILGTGFMVGGDGHVVTAQHVIEAARTQTSTAGARVVAGLAQPNSANMRANFSIVDFDVVDEDARHDLALLRLRQNPFSGEIRSGIVINGVEIPLLYGSADFDFNRPRDGQAIAISGYPLGIPVLVTSHGCIASSWSFDVQHLPFPGLRGVILPQVADIYLADVEVNPGNSGGPAYSVEKGEVIGICVASRLTPIVDPTGNPANLFGSSGLTIIVPAQYIDELLDKNGVPRKAPPSARKRSRSPAFEDLVGTVGRLVCRFLPRAWRRGHRKV